MFNVFNALIRLYVPVAAAVAVYLAEIANVVTGYDNQHLSRQPLSVQLISLTIEMAVGPYNVETAGSFVKAGRAGRSRGRHTTRSKC